MTQNMPWASSLRFKIGGSTLLLLVLSALFIATNFYNLRGFADNLKSITYTGKGRTAHPILYELGKLPTATEQELAVSLNELRRLVAETDRGLAALTRGDAQLGIKPEESPQIIANLQAREQLWRTDIRPVLERIIVASPDAAPSGEVERLDRPLKQLASLVESGLDLRERAEAAELARLELLQWLFSAVLLSILLLVLWLSQQVVRRVIALADTAEKISAGDLDLAAPVEGRDELTMLGASFNGMTAKLRGIIELEREGRGKLEELLAAIVDTTNSLASAAAEILAGTAQQSTGMSEQSSAVAETVTTVDEVLQTAEQAAERANAVSNSSQRAAEISSAGRKSIDETVDSMLVVQEQSASMAEGILRLAEHGQEIGEIIAAVTDIADQTNLLAVNASIEASRAGEHGKGFTAVATEIKELADQSKKATAQVRQILGEIQKATNTAVMAAEEGTKSVTRALKSVNEGGETIKALEATITDAARAATQIAASAAQQSTGMSQIQQAMAHINQASSQNLAATRQTEQAAQDLNALGAKLKNLLAGHGR